MPSLHLHRRAVPALVLIAVSLGACGSSGRVLRLTNGEYVAGRVVDQDAFAIYLASDTRAQPRRVPRASIAAVGVAETRPPVAGLVVMGAGALVTTVSAASFEDCSGDAEDFCGFGNVGPAVGVLAGGTVFMVGVLVAVIEASSAHPVYRFDEADRAAPPPDEPSLQVTPTGVALTW